MYAIVYLNIAAPVLPSARLPLFPPCQPKQTPLQNPLLRPYRPQTSCENRSVGAMQ